MDNIEEKLNDMFKNMCKSIGLTEEFMHDDIMLKKFTCEVGKETFEKQKRESEKLANIQSKLKTKAAIETTRELSNELFPKIVEMEESYLAAKKEYKEALTIYETVYGEFKEE